MPEKDSSIACTLAAAIIVLMIPLILLVRGLALMFLWRWFVVPFGVIEIGAVHAYGLVFFTQLFYETKKTTEDKTDADVIASVCHVLFVGLGTPAFILLIGYLLSFWM